MPAVIVLGDRTDHGGEVIEASGVTDTYGRRIARVGDKVTCPKKGHGSTTIITTGDLTFIIDGRAVAYHGCKTACGATLISSQAVTTVEFGSSSGSTGAAQPSASRGSNQAAAAVAFAQGSASDQAASSAIYDEQFEVRDESGSLLVGIPYTVKLPTGELRHGRTDDNGCTARYETEGAQTIEIFLGHI